MKPCDCKATCCRSVGNEVFGATGPRCNSATVACRPAPYNFCLPERDKSMARLRPTGLEFSCCAVILLTTVGRPGHSTLALGFGMMSVFLFFCLGWSDGCGCFLEQAGVEPLSKHLQEVWNEPNAMPMDRWLIDSVSQDDRFRLHQLGNCVVPCMAALAMDILTRVKSRGACIPA